MATIPSQLAKKMLKMAVLACWLLHQGRGANPQDVPSVSFVSNFFRSANIQELSLLLCSHPRELVNYGRQLIAAGLKVCYSLKTGGGVRRSGVLIDLSCPKAAHQIDSGKEALRTPLVEWLAFGDGQLELLPLRPDSRFTFYTHDGRLLDLFRVNMDMPLRKMEFSLGDKRNHSDLMGAFISMALLSKTKKISTEKNKRFLFEGLECMDDEEGSWNPHMALPLVRTLANRMNFSLKLVRPEDRSCEDLEWMLKNKSVVMSATPLMISHERMDYLEFSSAIFQMRSTIVYKQPGISSMSNIYVLPFHHEVWFSCLATSLLTLLVLSASLRAGGAFDEPYVTFPEMVTLVIGFICQQGSHLTPRSLAVKINLVIFSLSALFLYTSYSANIVALLQSSSPTLNSLSQLAVSPLTLLLHDTNYNRLLLQESNNSEVKELIRMKKVGPKSYTSPRKGIVEMRKGTSAFSVETRLGYRLVSEQFEEPEKCKLAELATFSMPPLAFPVIKASGYREEFTRMLRAEMEVGLGERLLESELKGRPECRSTDSGFVSVSLTDFKPALLVLLYCGGAALSALLLELVASRLRKNQPINFKDVSNG